MSAAAQIDYGSHAPAGTIDYGSHAAADDRGAQELSRFQTEHPDYKGPVSRLDTSDHSSDPEMQAVLKFQANHPYISGALHGLFGSEIPITPIPMDLPGSGASLIGRTWDALKASIADPGIREKAFKAFIPHGKEILEWKDAIKEAEAGLAKAVPDPALDAAAVRLGAKDYASADPALKRYADAIVKGAQARPAAATPAPLAANSPTDAPLNAAIAPSTPIPELQVGGGGPVRPPLAQAGAAPPSVPASLPEPVNTDLSTKLAQALRDAKLSAGFDPDRPLGELAHGRYPARFAGSDSPIIDSGLRKAGSTAEIANPERLLSKTKFLDQLPDSSPLRNNPKALDAAYKMALELKKTGISSIGDLMKDSTK